MQAISSEITVFIPTFNRHQWLRRAMESVLQETRVPILLHVFDNASTDGTEAFVAGIAATDPRVRYTRQTTNVGGTENYRTAFQSVATEYFVPLADDDWLLPDYLFEAYQQIQQNEELGAVIFVTEGRTANGEVAGQYPSQLDRRILGFLTPDMHLRDWMRYGHYHWSSVVWRKNALDSIGLTFLDTGLPGDVDFQLQIFCRYPVYLTNKPGAVYCLHENQASRGYNLSNLHSWVSVFARLDRAMREYKIFSAIEYAQLRKSMQALFKDLWNLPAETTLEGRKLLSTAVSAGFRLGDWDLAFKLLNRYIDAQPGTKPDTAIKTFMLPEIATPAEPEPEKYLSRIPGLLPSIVAWFKLNNDRLRFSTAASRESQASEIDVKLSGCLKEMEALNASVARWRAKAEFAKAENERLKAKINTMREERKKQSETRWPARIRHWWRRVRGKTSQS
jgi:glycosyltransferase involved in cell wall biosynthesis